MIQLLHNTLEVEGTSVILLPNIIVSVLLLNIAGDGQRFS